MAFPQPSGQGRAAQLSLVAALSSWLSGTDVAELAREMLPTVEDSSWRLEHTVDAVSGAFEYYLSWVVGIVVEQANTQLESASAPVRRRQEVAAPAPAGRGALRARPGPRGAFDLANTGFGVNFAAACRVPDPAQGQY